MYGADALLTARQSAKREKTMAYKTLLVPNPHACKYPPVSMANVSATLPLGSEFAFLKLEC